jgi:glycosyltransferase involved in cell wall biosynthesis
MNSSFIGERGVKLSACAVYFVLVVRVEVDMLMKTETKTVEKGWQEEHTNNLTRLLFEQRLVKISVVIPTLNEEENLAYVLPGIQQWVDEVILVDGNSSDQTVNVARRLYPSVRVVMQEGRGKGAALRTGFAAATGDIIIMLDADGSTDPAEIPLFVGALLSGADFAKGSRFLQGGGTTDMPLYRQLGNWGFVSIVRLIFGGKYTDLCYGYNAFWKRVLPLLELDCHGFEVETMMNVRALKAGLQITEVPSFEFSRIHGRGHLKTIPDGWRVLKTILREAANQRGWVLGGAATTRKRRLKPELHNVSAMKTNATSGLDVE